MTRPPLGQEVLDPALANPAVVAVSVTEDLLGQFVLNVPDHVLMDWQEEIIQRVDDAPNACVNGGY